MLIPIFFSSPPCHGIYCTRTSGGLPGRTDTVFTAAEAWTWLCRSFSKVQRGKVKRLLVNELATGLHLFLMKKNSRPDACHFFLDHVYLEVFAVEVSPININTIRRLSSNSWMRQLCLIYLFDNLCKNLFSFWKYKWIVWYWIRYSQKLETFRLFPFLLPLLARNKLKKEF